MVMPVTSVQTIFLFMGVSVELAKIQIAKPALILILQEDA